MPLRRYPCFRICSPKTWIVSAWSANPLTMSKQTMKEWIVIEHPKPADYKNDLALFKEAKAFVEAEKKRKKEPIS